MRNGSKEEVNLVIRYRYRCEVDLRKEMINRNLSLAAQARAQKRVSYWNIQLRNLELESEGR